MQINITGKNMKITKALRDFVNKKIKKVIVDFERPIDCEVILSVEKNNRHIAELIISGDSNKFYFNGRYLTLQQLYKETEYFRKLMETLRNKSKSNKEKKDESII